MDFLEIVYRRLGKSFSLGLRDLIPELFRGKLPGWHRDGQRQHKKKYHANNVESYLHAIPPVIVVFPRFFYYTSEKRIFLPGEKCRMMEKKKTRVCPGGKIISP